MIAKPRGHSLRPDEGFNPKRLNAEPRNSVTVQLDGGSLTAAGSLAPQWEDS